MRRASAQRTPADNSRDRPCSRSSSYPKPAESPNRCSAPPTSASSPKRVSTRAARYNCTMSQSAPIRRWHFFALLAVCAAPALAGAADQPQWGRAWSRNMASDETGLPDDFDPGTGRNVKWVADLGSQSYATPVVAGGRVLIGTNNDNPRDRRHQGDRAVLLCLAE